MYRFAIVVLAVACGCGSDKPTNTVDAPGDHAIDAPSSTGELGPLMPHAIAGSATAILATPKVVAITYDGDTNRPTVEGFYAAYSASPAWAAQTAEFGVGPITSATVQHLAGPIPQTITDAVVLGKLHANLEGANPAWGAPDPNTLYSFVFPNGTILDDGTGSKCCTDYDGYHYDETVGGVDVAYAIQCNCPGFDGPGVTDIQQLTVVMGHEAIEAVTDPHPSSNPLGFGDVDADHQAWSYVTGGELGDLCEYADTAYLLAPMDLTYAIQRTWSNAAAAAGHDPCVSEATTPYYQAVPDQPDTISITQWTNAPAKGTKIALGATGTITLHVLADQASAGPFTVTLGDYNKDYLGGNALLTFVQPTGTFNVGDTITVATTVVGADPNLGAGETFYVTTAPANGPATYWYGLVGQ